MSFIIKGEDFFLGGGGEYASITWKCLHFRTVRFYKFEF